MSKKMLTIRAISSIHSGSGQASGAIDQPVIREKITNWPYLNGERIKGVLRDACDANLPYGTDQKEDPFFQAFGPPPKNASDFAGALLLSDALLLCFPVRSFFGAVAWITCPLALLRWSDDFQALGSSSPLTIPSINSAESILITPDSVLKDPGDASAHVYLEAFRLASKPQEIAGEIVNQILDRTFPANSPWREHVRDRFGIVSDDLFTQLVQRGTNNSARIRLEQSSKTAAEGALWFEEDVPAEALFTATARIRQTRDPATELWDLLERSTNQPIQIGGNRSTGHGLAWFTLSGNGDPE